MKRVLLPVMLCTLCFTGGCKTDSAHTASPSPVASATTTPQPTSKSGSALDMLANGRSKNFDLIAGVWDNSTDFGQIYFTVANEHYALQPAKDASFLDAGTSELETAPETGYTDGMMNIAVGHAYLIKIPGNPVRYARIKLTVAQSNVIRFDYVVRLDGKRDF